MKNRKKKEERQEGRRGRENKKPPNGRDISANFPHTVGTGDCRNRRKTAAG